MPYSVDALRQWTIPVAPGVVLSKGEFVFQSKDSQGLAAGPSASRSGDVEFHVVCGGGFFLVPGSQPGVEVQSNFFKTTLDPSGQVTAPKFVLGPEEGLNTFVVETLYASHDVHVVGTYDTTVLEVLAPVGADLEQVARRPNGRQVDVVVLAKEKAYNSAPVPNLLLEMEVVNGACGFVYEGMGHYGILATGDDGKLKAELNLGNRKDLVRVQISGYRNRNVAGATFDINVRTPALNNPDSSNDLGSLPLLSAAPPVRPSVSDARTKAVSASDVAQPNLLIHCETPNANVVELHGTENSSGGWGSTTIAHPRQPGAFELDLRLPDFPDTETLKIKGVGKSPLDTGLISISQLPAYIEATRAGDRDGHFGISGQVKNDAIRYLGPSREVAQPFIVEIDLFKGTGNEAIVEMDLDFKVRAAPINSSVDDPSPASKDMIPGKIRVTEIQIPSGIFPSYTAHPPFVIHPPITIRPPISIPVGGVTPKPPPSGGPAPVPPAGAGWVDEVKEVLTQLRPYTYKVEFQSSAKNRDNLVEITAVAKVLVTDPNGVTSVVSRQTNLTLRLAALQPRIYFVREAAPGKFVPILDSSIIPVTYFKADGTPESIPKDAQFFVEVLSDDVGTSLDCWIFAGHQIKVPASRVQFALQYSRYRTAAYTVYLDNDNGGQTVAPPPLPFIHSAGANTLRAFVDNPNYPGKDEIGTPDRPMTSFQLIQVGDALQRDRIIAPKLHIDTNVDATWNTMAAGTDAIVEVRGWVRDFFADLSSAAAPTQVLVNGATVPLAGAAETKSYGRPFAWKGSFSAKIKVPLGVQVITIRVENAMKAATERRFLAEVGTRPNVLAGGTSFVTSVREIGGGQKHPAPFLQYLCVRAGSLGATLAPPPPFSARVSALAPYPATGAVGTPLKLTMSPLPGTTATYYRSDLFYTLPADLVAPTGLPTGTTGLAVPRGGRLEWEATAIPNLLRPIHLLNRLEFWSLAQTIRRKTPAGWEVARQINTGDTITVEVQEYPPKHRGQLQLQLRFQDPTGLFSDNPDHVLSFDANETNPAQGIYTMSDVNTRGNVGQTSPATEVVVLGDAADAPLGGGYIRVRAVGQMVVGGAVYPVDPVPVFAKPKRYVVNGAPMPQETYRVAVPRLGACGSVVPGTGELVFVETDRAVPGRQYDVQFSRTYRSGNDYESSLGFGWSPSWNVFLWRESRERIRMFSDAAMLVDFVRGASGWESPDGIYAKLEEDAAGFFRLRTRVGQFMTFAPVGGLEGLYYVLVTMEDRFGNRMRQSYAAHGGVFRIVDMMGRNFALHHDVITRRLAGLGDYSGSDVKFGMYGANDPNGVAGSLLTVRSPIITNPDNPFPAGRTTSYSYYLAPDQHRLHVRTDPKNGTIAMTYDANGHVSEQAHGKGKYVFSPQGTSLTWYDRKKQARQLQFAPSSPGFAPFLKSTVNHVRGRDVTHSYLYNRHGEMTRHDFPAGNAEQLAFDENANDPRDRGNLKDRWLFPSKGSELVTRTVGVYDPKVDPQPVAIQSIHESFEYEPGLQLLIRHKDALGRETRHVYKGGVLQKSVYPTVSKGGAKGVLQSRERSYEWNELGQLTAEVDPNGVTTRYTYFPDSDPIGAGGGLVSPLVGRHGYLSDLEQDVVNPRATRAPELAPLRTVKFSYRYDELGNRIAIDDHVSGALIYGYNESCELVLMVGREKETTKHRYSANGELSETETTVTDLSFPADIPSAVPRVVVDAYEYNESGNLVAMTIDKNGTKILTRWELDANDNVEYMHYPVANATSKFAQPLCRVFYTYDEADRLQTETSGYGSPNAVVKNYDYDDNGKIRTETYPATGLFTKHLRDGFTRTLGQEDALGNRIERQLDDVGNITREISRGSVDGDPKKVAVLRDTVTYFDEADRAVAVKDRSFELVLSSAGTYIEKAIGAGYRVHQNFFDANGTLVRTVDPYLVDTSLQVDGHGLPCLITDSERRSVSTIYDAVNMPKLITRTDQVSSLLTTRTYAPSGRLQTEQLNVAPMKRSYWDSMGNLRVSEDELGNRVEYRYDVTGRRVATVQRMYAQGRRVNDNGSVNPLLQQFESEELFDENGRLRAATDFNGNTVGSYDYDECNRLTRKNEGAPYQYFYRGDGLIDYVIDPDKRRIGHRYDSAGRLAERTVTHPDPKMLVGTTLERFVHDGLSRIVEATDNNGAPSGWSIVTNRYTSLGSVSSTTQSEGFGGSGPSESISYAYWDNGRRVHTLYPDQSHEIATIPNRLGATFEVSDLKNNANIAQYTYLGADYQFRRYPNGLAFGMHTDANKQLDGIRTYRGNDFFDASQMVLGHQYENASNALVKTDVNLTDNTLTRFEYDSLYRQLSALSGIDPKKPTSVPKSASLKQFDHSGNPASRTEGAVASVTPSGIVVFSTSTNVTYAVNAQNQVTGSTKLDGTTAAKLEARSFGYDSRGNIATEKATDAQGSPLPNIGYDCKYDYKNRLVEATNLADPKTTHHVYYDAFDRRVRKDDIRFVWSDEDLIKEYPDSGKWFKRYVYGSKPGELVLYETNIHGATTSFFVQQNLNGSVDFLTDSSGNIVERYSIGASGLPAVLNPNGTSPQPSGSQTGNPFMTHRQYFDAELNLYMVGSRMLHPDLGRFMQRDPSGPLGDPRSHGNAYTYGANNPALFSDNGRIAFVPILIFVAAGALVGFALGAVMGTLREVFLSLWFRDHYFDSSAVWQSAVYGAIWGAVLGPVFGSIGARAQAALGIGFALYGAGKTLVDYHEGRINGAEAFFDFSADVVFAVLAAGQMRSANRQMAPAKRSEAVPVRETTTLPESRAIEAQVRRAPVTKSSHLGTRILQNQQTINFKVMFERPSKYRKAIIGAISAGKDEYVSTHPGFLRENLHARHVVSAEYIAGILQETISAASNPVEYLRRIGYDPAEMGGMQKAIRKCFLDKYNDPNNLWIGPKWENEALGRLIGSDRHWNEGRARIDMPAVDGVLIKSVLARL